MLVLDFTFISCNARSIVNKMDEMTATVELYHPDVIGITETWLRADINKKPTN